MNAHIHLEYLKSYLYKGGIQLKKFECTIVFQDEKGGVFNFIVEADDDVSVRNEIFKEMKLEYPDRNQYFVYEVREIS